MTITGVRMDEYPVLGAHFVSEDDLPDLYGYAVPALRFISFSRSVFNECLRLEYIVIILSTVFTNAWCMY